MWTIIRVKELKRLRQNERLSKKLTATMISAYEKIVGYTEYLESRFKIQETKAEKIADKLEKLLNGNK